MPRSEPIYLSVTGANIILPERARKLNEMVPAILNQDAESTLLDVPTP